MKIVIFCGGYGTRMWPASRKSFPKQFYPLVKGKSLFQMTYHRFRKIFKPSDIFVSTERKYTKFVEEQVPDVPIENIIAEPERKDNLGAVGLVTAILEKRFPGEVMFVSWSDHFIGKESTFLKAVVIAGKFAKETGLIVSVNEKPKAPSVHNEWVRIGEMIEETKGFQIVKILETIKRPDLENAKKMFISDKYLLNTGYRAWRTDVMLEYYKNYTPEMYKGLIKIADAIGTKYEKTVIYREYHKFIKDSVEFGIFVKLPSDKSATIPTDFGWEDAGTWELFYRALRDHQENVVEGQVDTEFIDANRNLIMGSKGKIVAVIGLSNIAIIDTPDGLLVCNMNDTSKVKDLFAILEKKKPKYVD